MSQTIQASPNPHLAHVEALLQGVKQRRDGTVEGRTPPEMYLVLDEGATFWEVLAIRMRGCPALLLGAVQFQRQGTDMQRYARRPLGLFLSAPPKELGVSKAARPAQMLEVWLPDAGESIAAFQQRLASGGRARTLFVDTEQVEFAFDFRFENPSVEREQGVYSGHPEKHLFRTARGHLVSGVSHGLHRKLHQSASFLTLRAPLQHTSKGAHLLPPALAVHRSFVALDALVREGETVADWTSGSVPFQLASAEQRHLLLPSTA